MDRCMAVRTAYVAGCHIYILCTTQVHGLKFELPMDVFAETIVTGIFTEFVPSVASRLQVLASTTVQEHLREFACVQFLSCFRRYGERFLRALLSICVKGSEILEQDNFDLRNDGVRCSSHLSGTSSLFGNVR